jgi:predicted Rdx family selenoprotein
MGGVGRDASYPVPYPYRSAVDVRGRTFRMQGRSSSCIGPCTPYACSTETDQNTYGHRLADACLMSSTLVNLLACEVTSVWNRKQNGRPLGTPRAHQRAVVCVVRPTTRYAHRPGSYLWY